MAVSSRCCDYVEEVSLAQCTELHIGKLDAPVVLDDNALESLLQEMPNLMRLSVEWRPDGRKLDIDIVSRHCPHLVELDLTRFRLDTWSLEQLCIACPKLEVVKLPRKSDDTHAEVLLRRLPHLRSLDLSHTKVTGQFLGTRHESMEKLSMAGCKDLNLEYIAQARSSAQNIPRTRHWENLRELDLSSTNIVVTKAHVFGYFPRLQRLSLAHAGITEIPDLSFYEHVRDLDISHATNLSAFGLVDLLNRRPELERLSVAGCTIRQSSRQRQPAPTDLRLRELDVSGVRGLGMDDLAAILRRSPQLERVLAAGLNPMDVSACMTHLMRRTQLHELDVSRLEVSTSPSYGCGWDTPNEIYEGSFITGNVLPTLLGGSPKLERLVLASCYIEQSASLRQLGCCPRLVELDVSRVRSVDASDLAQGLRGCPLLERLSVAGIQASLEQLVPPTGLPQLTYLDASDSELTNNSLRRLPGLLPKLQTLCMQGCDSVSEDGLLSYLPRLQQLRSLDIRNVPGVTDSLLEKLKKCHLTKLRLDGPGFNTSVTPAGLIGLVHGCQSLTFLWLERPSSAESLTYRLRERLSLGRYIAFVDHVGKTRRFKRQPCSLQTSLLLEVEADEWERD